MNFKQSTLIIISIFFLFGIFSPKAQAYVTPEELTSPEALINYNYSPTAADHVQLSKAQNNNREYKSGRFSKKPWWRKAWEYIDFGTDDGYLLQREINPGYTWRDR